MSNELDTLIAELRKVCAALENPDDVDAVDAALDAFPKALDAYFLELARAQCDLYRKDARDEFDAKLAAKMDDAEIIAALKGKE